MFAAMSRQPNRSQETTNIKGRLAGLQNRTPANEDAITPSKLNKNRRARGEKEITPQKSERKIPGWAETQIDEARMRQRSSRASSYASSHRK
jgi:hypothetical protein